MNLLPALRQLMRRWLRRGPAEPQDPYAHVWAPLRSGPDGRSSAVALEEPREAKPINAFGRWRSPNRLAVHMEGLLGAANAGCGIAAGGGVETGAPWRGASASTTTQVLPSLVRPVVQRP